MMRMGWSIAAIAFASMSLGACGPSAKYVRGGGAIAAVRTTAVDWNPSHVDLGKPAAVADDGDDVVVFGASAALIFRGGALVASPLTAKPFVDATVLPALDGSGKWIVGIDRDGGMFRVRGRATLEPIGDRFGLSNASVRGARSLGGALVAFDEGGHLAIADESKLARFDVAPLVSFGGGGGYGAAIVRNEDRSLVRLLDVRHGEDRTFDLDGARYVAVDDAGNLFAASDRGVWSSEANRLRLRYASPDGSIHGLVSSGIRAWVADGEALCVLESSQPDGTPIVAATDAKTIAPDARLFGSASGDVWAVAGASVSRIRTVRQAGVGAPWEHDVQPIFRRVCSTCHEAGGDGGVDLSTESAWLGKRDVIRARVIDKRNMPPRDFSLRDDELAAITKWLGK